MRINIIGDIAGRYDELLLLLEKMPEADLILSVGDLVDRGPKSKEVIEWFIKQQKAGKAEAIYGNHEDMMVEGCVNSNSADWMRNGGYQTLVSYMSDEDYYDRKDARTCALIPKSHIDWLQKRPMYFQTDNLFVSHAPVTSLKNIPSNPYDRNPYFIWNRYEPGKPQEKFLINGHNGKLREYKWGDGSVFGMCVDDSHQKKLTGLHWPTKEIFQVDFLPVEEKKQRPQTPEELAKEEDARKNLEKLMSSFF
jgi:serine/threonine protein phosphatase 1